MNKTAISTIIGSVVTAMIFSSSVALAGGLSKNAKRAAKKAPTEMVNLIVTYKHDLKFKHQDKINKKHGKIRRKLKKIKGQAITLPAGEINNLSMDPDVAMISLDHPVANLGKKIQSPQRQRKVFRHL